MSDKHLHIIAFDIPYPPNYGGVIDVWHKIRTLHRMGVKIYLHCFEYPGRDRASELNALCEEVNYYPRQLGMRQAISFTPYIIATRKSEKLLHRLLQDNYPVLFEGLHSCYYLNNKLLKGRKLIYRESNIEHRYYYNLFKTTNNLYLKSYYLAESLKLRWFERKIQHASAAAVVSKADQEELQQRYPRMQVELIPSFHANDQLRLKPGSSDYVLYHGNLEVAENENAVFYLLNEVFTDYPRKLIVAGMNPRQRLIRAIEKLDNITLIANPSQEEMDSLVKNAHVNLLVTFQATGLKLKLLNALYSGRFALVNDKMVRGTYLKELCSIANTPQEIKNQLEVLFEKNFDKNEIAGREKLLVKYYSNNTNADKLLELLFD